MPVTINSPNFWNLTLDNFINKSDRELQEMTPDGKYLHRRPTDEETTVRVPDRQSSQTFLPLGGSYVGYDAPKARTADPVRGYNNIMRAMEREAAKDVIPYNGLPIDLNYAPDPDLLDAVRQWINSGGSKRYGTF
jgi:hypothetical protein